MTQEPITDKTLSEAEKEVINEDPDYKEYQEIDLQVLLKSGTSRSAKASLERTRA